LADWQLFSEFKEVNAGIPEEGIIATFEQSLPERRGIGILWR